MWPDSLDMDVSRESLEKLEIYHALLLKWQKAINLVAPKTVNEAWVRHFADSVQVERYIEPDVSRESSVLFDLGSGAGFPGMVLAILRPDLDVHIIESDFKKCEFIRTVSRETDIPITIHNQRIEDGVEGMVPNFVTARALADLNALMGFCAGWADSNPNLKMYFMKGERAQEEIGAAQRDFLFDVQAHESITDPQASILEIKKLQRM